MRGRLASKGMATTALGVGQRESGILLGGTVHDVAQVVAAAHPQEDRVTGV